MYESENGRHYYYPLLVLRYCYNIPTSFEEKYLNIFWIKYTAVMLFRLSVGFVLPLLHLVMSLKDKTGVSTAEDLSTSMGAIAGTFVVIQFTLQYKKWSEFFTEVTIIKKFHLAVNVERFVRNFNRFSIIYLCYVLTGITLYGIVGLGESSRCKQLNEEKGLHEICIRFLPIWLPFDTSDIFSTVIIFTVQAIIATQALATSAMVFVIVLESTEILILHINILKENFSSLFDDASNEKISAKLRFCINYHNHILGLGQRFNILQKRSVGHMSFMAALVFGCILNQIQNVKPFGAILYLLGYITAIAIACHAGQRIIDESSSIADAIHSSKWFKADPQTMKDLALVILRCQRPLYFSCTPLGTNDYALFITILKTSYSYLTLLNSTN